METKRISLVLTAISGLSAGCWAQSTAYPVSTDRPSFSDGTGIVPLGHPQVELGYTRSLAQGTYSETFGEGLFRFALSRVFEFRVLNITDQLNYGGSSSSGFLDPAIGFKWQFQPGVFSGKKKRPELSLVFLTTLPDGSRAYRASTIQPTVKLAYYYGLSPAWGVGGNFIVSLNNPGSAFTQYSNSLYVTDQINAKVGLFLETFRNDPVSYGSTGGQFADFGVEYLLNKRIQLDARIGTAFDQSTYGTYFGFGISFRY